MRRNLNRIVCVWGGLIIAALACARTLYLRPSSNWKKDNARFAIYMFGNGDGWTSMTSVSGETDLYQGTIDDKYPKVIFCRMNPATTENNWNKDVKWNQTADLTLGTENMYTIAEGAWDYGNGTWSTYTPAGGGDTPGGGDNPGGGDTPGGGDPIDPVTPGDYEKAVPAECEDIMLQAFYWDSSNDHGFGTSKWMDLKNKASEINPYFDMVWLPPSCKTKDNMGYIPAQYSNQNSNVWGNEYELKALINAFHNGGTRVIADIVINHSGDVNTVEFMDQDFGEYGHYYPQTSWITQNDEHGQSGSHPDDGQHDANYGSARDWDHQNVNVQNMCKAYLKFLKNTIGYDGFRYDYAGGFNVRHLNDYNAASGPYFSVMEYWVEDANEIKTRVNEASQNTLAFDFPGRAAAFKQGIAKNDYSKCKNAGMRGKGCSKYAVTFVDNHDTFQRTNTESDIKNSTDGASVNDRALMLQCNAYILSMPGVPCVFWPHWVKYKNEIQKMIIARKSAGIHSESAVSEQSGNGWYEATVTGKYGNVVLYIGSSATKAAPEGYTLALKESKIAMYYTGETYVPGTDTGGEGGEVLPEIDPDVYDGVTYKFYAMGWINSSDAGESASKTYDDKYLFKDGKLTIECKQGSYIGIKDEQGNYYYTKGNSDTQGNKATCYWANGWSPCRKWALVEGTHYIIMRKVKFKGEIVLESVDKKTYDAYHIIPQVQATENVEVTEKARKILVNGQLRILRGDNIYTITGARVQ